KTEQILPDGGKEGKFALNGIKGMCVVRRLDAPMAEALKPDPVKKLTWLESLSQPGKPAVYEPRFVSPSSVEMPVGRSSQKGEKGDIAVEVIKLADHAIRIGKDPEVENEDVGNAVHAYFAALPSLVECSPKDKESVALRCLVSYGVDKLISATDLVAMGERLQSWIDKTYPGAVWKCEIPFMAPKKSPSVSDGAGKDGESGHWNGIIDLLLLLPDGKAVIIDHKASAISPEKSADKARSYAGQLLAYRESLEAQGMEVEAMWVHFALAGVVGGICR
ncbi:MAG: PD-(D/E)XK nuclease family protein, partial [Planctomycetota bacterium]